MTVPASKPLPPIGVADAIRFAKYVDQSGGPDACWPWTASGVDGYGYFRLGKRKVRAHRVAWVMWSGEPEPGPELDLDHTCHDATVCRGRCPHRRCCNPRHLRTATPRQNIANSNARSHQLAARTHCGQGHEYTSENTRLSQGYRQCRRCDAENHVAARLRVG